MIKKAPEINCPTCNKTVVWNDKSAYRPFCSKRCQQIDFGDWALENHRIPGEGLATYTEDDSPEPQH